MPQKPSERSPLPAPFRTLRCRAVRIGVTLLLAASSSVAASAGPGELLQLVDYVGVDYPDAVSNGTVVNDAEYAEMRDFSRRILEGLETLEESPARIELSNDAATLARRIETKAPTGEVAAVTRRMRDTLMRAYPVASTPLRAPDLERARELYRSNCASCHGARGFGNGPSAADLEPPPTNFHDTARARERSLYGLYNTITLGVDGTGMAAFSHLSDDERWALAFYVGGMYASRTSRAEAEMAWQGSGGPSLREIVTRAPAELGEAGSEVAGMAAMARHHPEVLFRGREPIVTAIARVEESVEAYESGDRRRAMSLAVSAYLEGFELAEASLSSASPGLVRAVEATMMDFRGAIADDADTAEIRRRAEVLSGLLRQAQGALDEEALSPTLAFVSSFVILLREGLEAILVLGAIIAFLVKTDRRRALPYVHYGWIGALLAGAATWALATWVVDVSGAAREVTEGVTALLAAGILFYVGFWMHDKLNARRWNRFLEEQIVKALDDRTLFGISLIAFVAVYREVFETVLFYQALWTQVEANGHGAMVAGMLAAAVMLVFVAWGVLRLGVRLPLRQFFAASGAVMFVLAVVFAGKGVAALQEAGKLPIDPVPFPRVDILGVYPTAQTLAAQAMLALAAAALVWWSRRGRPAAA